MKTLIIMFVVILGMALTSCSNKKFYEYKARTIVDYTDSDPISRIIPAYSIPKIDIYNAGDTVFLDENYVISPIGTIMVTLDSLPIRLVQLDLEGYN